MRNLIYAALMTGLIAAPVAAARQTPQQRLDKLIAGRTAGKPVDCIQLNRSSNDSEKIPGLAMAYRQGTTWYVNRFQGGCPQLDENTILVTKTWSGQLCRGDIADLRDNGTRMTVGSCIFDSFIPYAKAD